MYSGPAMARTALTLAAVVDGALALADAEGLAAVTVRRLAGELGVTPMALYWHVRSKDELLDGMAAGVLERVDRSVDPAAPWQEQLRSLLGSLVAALRAHPAAAVLVATRTVSSEEGLRVTETLLDVLRRGGFPPAEATHVARHAVATAAHLVGSQPGAVSGRSAEVDERARLLLESLPPERFPRLVEASVPLTRSTDPDAYVALGLELLLAGITTVAAR